MSAAAPARRAGLYLLLFVCLFLPYAYFTNNDGWNQISRLAALHAVVIKQTIVIDDYRVYTGDKAFINGHYYSEKAPGVAVLALPAFGLTVLVQRMMGIDPDAARAWNASAWIATAGSVRAIVALAGVAFFALLGNRFDARVSLLATIGVWLGTLAFPYATSLFSHAATMGLLAIALWGVLDTSRSPGRDYVAGACAGLAVASEYPGIIGAACLAIYVWSQDRDRARRFCLALLPGLLLILMNNYRLTGSPLQLAYGSNPDFPTEDAAHNYGHGAPTLGAIVGLLWGEYRGLFFWNPVLLMALPGLVALARFDRAAALLIAAMSALSLLQVASFHNWFGGFAVGPRYLLPGLSALGLAAGWGIARFPRTGAVLSALSVALMAMTAAVGIAPPQNLLTPLRDYYFNRIQLGLFAPNLGTLVGLSPVASLALLALAMAIIGGMLARRSRHA